MTISLSLTVIENPLLSFTALISVYDKSSLKKICYVLNKFNIGIISTGTTAKKIIALGYKCKEISNLTKFKEILDGRVKTLNSKLHASNLIDIKVSTLKANSD